MFINNFAGALHCFAAHVTPSPLNATDLKRIRLSHSTPADHVLTSTRVVVPLSLLLIYLFFDFAYFRQCQ